MATAIITKQSVTKLNDMDYQVTIHILIRDTLENIVFEKDYSERYYSALQVDAIKVKLQNQFVADWNQYKAEQNILNAATFDTIVSQLEAAANIYINQ